MTTLLYIGIGLAIGALSGALGIGGGVLLVPALIWLCDFEPKKATGTSLAILVPPIGLPAALHALRKDQVDLEAALWIAGAFIVGAYGSRMVIDYLPDLVLRLIFGLLMIYVAVRFMVSSDREAASAAAGLIAVGLAWLAFVALRGLGRRALKAPNLHDEVQRMAREGHGDPDYYI